MYVARIVDMNVPARLLYHMVGIEAGGPGHDKSIYAQDLDYSASIDMMAEAIINTILGIPTEY